VVIRLALAVILALCGTFSVARADRLAEARRAIDEVRFADARKLLVEAIDAGGASPPELRQLYELSAQAAIVLGQRELGEQYYRRWLALDPAAALPPGSSPKLSDAFVAAKAYMAAHGRLAVKAERRATEVLVIVESDPLAMASSAALAGASTTPRVAFAADRRASLALPSQPAALRVFVLDDRGNQLLVIDVAAEASDGPNSGGNGGANGSGTNGAHSNGKLVGPPAPREEPRPFLRQWTTWGVPAGGLLLAGAIVGIVALGQQSKLADDIKRSGENFFPDADARHDQIRRNATIAIALAGADALFAIPATVFFIQSRRPWNLSLVPQPAGLNLNLSIRF
jgi:hypothetical protein